MTNPSEAEMQTLMASAEAKAALIAKQAVVLIFYRGGW